LNPPICTPLRRCFVLKVRLKFGTLCHGSRFFENLTLFIGLPARFALGMQPNATPCYSEKNVGWFGRTITSGVGAASAESRGSGF
jgi:hypothetical protein